MRELGLYSEHSKAYLERFGRQAELGANDDERPWEATALGREVVRPHKAPYVRARTYPSIAPFAPNAHEFAEKANEQALEGYRSKNYQLCYDAASEAIRLNPQKSHTSPTAQPRRSSCAARRTCGRRSTTARWRWRSSPTTSSRTCARRGALPDG